MWFLLGIVSFTGLFAYRLWRKFYWSWGWSGDEGYLRQGGRRYKTRQSENKGTHRFGYAVTCPPGFYFRIKRETNWDRWAKGIGLSTEQQVSDSEFDDKLYIASDDPAWLAELGRVPELRNVLKALFRDINVRTITCEGRHVSVDVQLQSDKTPLEYVNGYAAKNIVSALHVVADLLGVAAKERAAGWRDPYAIKAVVVVSLASALLLHAVAESFRLFWIERGDVMIDGSGLLASSTVAAAVLVAGWLLATAALLRGSSHAHLVMAEVLLSGGLGLVGSGYALARDVNCEWDKAAATAHVLTVTNKYTGHRRKYGTYYQISFDVQAGAGIPRTIEVGSSTYSKATVGQPIAVFVKPGYLGYRWIEDIRRPDS